MKTKEEKLEVIWEMLEHFWFYIWNSDWEFSEKNYEKVKEDLYEAIEDEKPFPILTYVGEYLQKNYPFHIWK